jgi:uncharacterized protein (DUF1778 family)
MKVMPRYSNAALKQPKKTRTTFLMDEFTKSLVDVASKYTNLSQTDFILTSVREKAERLAKERAETLSQIVPLVLNEKESKRFFQILERDWAPTKAMLELNKKRHHDIVELA